MSSLPPIGTFFGTKKRRIISELEASNVQYQDKSPKGSIDIQIIDLIEEINGYEGLVTTSSCAGRVTVFVEGSKDYDNIDNHEQQQNQNQVLNNAIGGKNVRLKGGPGGKGGGHWLYVSHDPLPIPSSTSQSMSYYTNLFGLSSSEASIQSMDENSSHSTRLIRLSFSPLILHIFCASLHYARPLLSAAINAGFRESGVQSLKSLDDPEHGAMVAVRTAGLSFETVIGFVGDSGNKAIMNSLVTEGYLQLCIRIINERFIWNLQRGHRFREELRKAIGREYIHHGLTTDNTSSSPSRVWESKDERQRRKREEGLKHQMQQRMQENNKAAKENEESDDIWESDQLAEDLTSLEIS